MSNYTTFRVITDRNQGNITFDNLPSAMRYMEFCEENGNFADLWSHSYAFDGTPLFTAELMSVNPTAGL